MDIPMMPSSDQLPKDDGQHHDTKHPQTYMHDPDREGMQRMDLDSRTHVPKDEDEARGVHSKPVDLDEIPDPTDRGIVASGNFNKDDSDALLASSNPAMPRPPGKGGE